MVKKVTNKKQVKKSTVKPKPATAWQKFTGFIKRNLPIIGVVIVLLVIAVFYGYKKVVIYQEKKQFEAVEVSLDKLHADIIAKLGEPVTDSSEKSCSYASVDYGKGRLRCGVSFNMTYGSQNLTTMKKMQQITLGVVKMNSSFNFISTNLSTYENPQLSSNIYESDISFEEVNSGFNCTESLYFNTETNDLELGIGCFKDSHAEHFPVKN